MEACIPLAFKLKVVKEEYEALTNEEKKEIDRRREADKKKRAVRIPKIDDDDGRIEKLLFHQRCATCTFTYGSI